MDFSEALKVLKKKDIMPRLTRRGWNAKGMWIQMMMIPSFGCLPVTKPFFRMFTASGDFAVWFPSICDLLAEDWEVVE